MSSPAIESVKLEGGAYKIELSGKIPQAQKERIMRLFREQPKQSFMHRLLARLRPGCAACRERAERYRLRAQIEALHEALSENAAFFSEEQLAQYRRDVALARSELKQPCSQS